MKTRTAFGSLILMVLLVLPAHADGKGQLQKHFTDTAKKVKATDNASEKRFILNESFTSMSKALAMIQDSPLISNADRAGIDRFRATLREKRDELTGTNGYARVSDEQLNAFSDYVIQDMEQADQVVTISLVTLLLIIILVVLIAR